MKMIRQALDVRPCDRRGPDDTPPRNGASVLLLDLRSPAANVPRELRRG